MPRRAMTTLQTPKPNGNVIPLTTPRLSITLSEVTNLKLLHQIIKIIRQQQLIIRLNEGILWRNLAWRENETTTARNRSSSSTRRTTTTTNRIVSMLYRTSGWNNGSMKWRGGGSSISRMRMVQRLIIRSRRHWRRHTSIVMWRWNALLMLHHLLLMLSMRRIHLLMMLLMLMLMLLWLLRRVTQLRMNNARTMTHLQMLLNETGIWRIDALPDTPWRAVTVWHGIAMSTRPSHAVLHEYIGLEFMSLIRSTCSGNMNVNISSARLRLRRGNVPRRRSRLLLLLWIGGIANHTIRSRSSTRIGNLQSSRSRMGSSTIR
mmetsp:Transcript_1682/g.2727  ORF Transcript_1682/g.2727 Transcript_1682/m.2727 type:complete len:318 (+) Transcript_1682:1346-2299(+)